jgi:hypothetical protein
VSGAAFGHFLLRVGDRALEGLYVVAFGLADDFLDGAGYGGFDFGGCRVRVGDDQAGAADGDGGPGLFLQFAGGLAVQQFAGPGAG